MEEMADFVLLWDSVQGLQLSNTPDSIAWKWTADGVYTAKSAYEAQFLGSYSPFRGEFIWQAEAEGLPLNEIRAQARSRKKGGS